MEINVKLNQAAVTHTLIPPQSPPPLRERERAVVCLHQVLSIIFSSKPAELNSFLSKKLSFHTLTEGLISGNSYIQSSKKGDLDEQF